MDPRTAIVRYSELKARGMVSLQKRGPAVFIAIRHFDSSTGDETASEAFPLDRPQLLAFRQALIDQAANLQALVNDIQAL